MTQARPAKSPRPRPAAEPPDDERTGSRPAAGKPDARVKVPADVKQAGARKTGAGKAGIDAAKDAAQTAATKKAGTKKAGRKKAGTKKAGARKSTGGSAGNSRGNRTARPGEAAPPIAARTASRKGEEPATGRRVQVKKSGVHGKGVYAARSIAKGETIIEYRGEVITWDEALRRHPHDPSDPNHTFYFHLDDGHVIDGKHIGNAAKWINHSCAPNCEAEQDGMRVFIKALRKIAAGEELFYDYGLVIDARITPKLKREYACWCGAKSCRGTMLAGRR